MSAGTFGRSNRGYVPLATYKGDKLHKTDAERSALGRGGRR
jgi:hypothetical protein